MKHENKKKWYQQVSSWVVIAACVILIPVIIMNLSIMFQAKANTNKVPSVFGIKPFMVLSGSMETEIKKGDLIITREINPEELEIGKVIAFRDAAGTVTTHRIIDIVVKDGETFFITKGDNNSTQDRNLVSLKDVEGIYLFRIPGIGSMMKSLSQTTTIVILVLIITVIFVVGFIISNKKYVEEERAEFLEYKRRKEMEARRRENMRRANPNYNSSQRVARPINRNDLNRDMNRRKVSNNTNRMVNKTNVQSDKVIRNREGQVRNSENRISRPTQSKNLNRNYRQNNKNRYNNSYNHKNDSENRRSR
ncbi:MAG: signal peptidase I [Bacilli bacterium]|nr:signal peptidase I [Bacilli bacterium]